MAIRQSLVEFATKSWPSLSLVAVFLTGAITIVVALLTDHSDQVMAILTFTGIVVTGLSTLYKLDRNREDVAQKIDDAKAEVVVNQAATETKIDQAKQTAQIAAVRVEKSRQETVAMLTNQNQVLDEIHKQTNGDGPVAELVRKFDQLVEKVDGHGRILEALTKKI